MDKMLITMRVVRARWQVRSVMGQKIQTPEWPQQICMGSVRPLIREQVRLPLKRPAFLHWLWKLSECMNFVISMIFFYWFLAFLFSPILTWRDIQHLTVLTSKRNSLFDAKNRFHWTMNGVGLEFNHLFGFGVLDAGAIVTLAKQWRTVPPRYHCEAGSQMEIRYVWFFLKICIYF